jgi:hypothetical protein
VQLREEVVAKGRVGERIGVKGGMSSHELDDLIKRYCENGDRWILTIQWVVGKVDI